MLNIERITTGLYYLTYNGRFVDSFDTQREAKRIKQQLERSGCMPA